MALIDTDDTPPPWQHDIILYTFIKVTLILASPRWFIWVINCMLCLLILVAKPRTLRKANIIPVPAKNPMKGIQTKDILILDVGGKPQRFIPGKTHTKRKGLKTPSTQCSRWDSNRVLEVEGEERYHNTNPTAQTKGELFWNHNPGSQELNNRPDTSQRHLRRLPPCPMVSALVPLKML